MSAEVSRIERESLTLEWGVATDVGKVRAINEDSYLLEPGLLLVADGMGGHQAGDEASRLAVQVMREELAGRDRRPDDIVAAITEVNRRVLASGEPDGRAPRGTTLVGVALIDNAGEDSLMVFHVGDSRCYQLPADGVLVRVTRDHSVVQELIDAGKLSEADVRTHPERGVVTRAIGVEPDVSADYAILAPVGRSRLLLCSDGVSGEVDDPRVREVLAGDGTPEEMARALVDEVLAGPAHDNATALVIDVEWKSVDAPGDTTGRRSEWEEITAPRAEVVAQAESSEEPGDLITSVPTTAEATDVSDAAVSGVEMIAGIPE